MNHLTCINYTAFSNNNSLGKSLRFRFQLQNDSKLKIVSELFLKMKCYNRKGYLQVLTADQLASFEESEGRMSTR